MGAEPVIIAYVPVLHRGYIDLFRRLSCPNARLLLIGQWFIAHKELNYLRKDIRCMDADDIARSLAPFGLFSSIDVLRTEDEFLGCTAVDVTMFASHIVDVFRQAYPGWFASRRVTVESTSLMWDRRVATTPENVVPDRTVVLEGAEAEWMRMALAEKEKSNDWWLHVGAVAVRGLPLITAHNTHLPNREEAYIEGDPRYVFHRGEYLYLSTASHAEAVLVGSAARNGISLGDADLFITMFPCPPCANLIMPAGLRRLFYIEGYSLTHAAARLRANGIEIIRVIGFK